MTIPDFGPVLDRAGRPLDQIRLLGLTARGRHGVFAHERRDGQDFTVDAVLHLDTRTAAAGDDLAATVDYGALAGRIAHVVQGEPVDLIETLAARIARTALAAPDCENVVAIDIAVHKPQAPIAEPFADVVVALRRYAAELPTPTGTDDLLERRPEAPVTAVLALGANLGDPAATLRAVLARLRTLPEVTVAAVSPVVQTTPVGGPEQPDYLNAVVLVRTTLSARELLAAGQRIESDHGRQRSVRWGPRTLDLDVIRYGDLISTDPALELPHPRAAQRGFVLLPWLAVDPQAWLPSRTGRIPVAGLPAAAPDPDGVRPRPDLPLDVSPG